MTRDTFIARLVLFLSDMCPERLPCEHGGYTDPHNCSTCRCLPELTGQLCTDISEGSPGLYVTSRSYPANTKHLYNIYTMLDQRRRRWARDEIETKFLISNY